MHSRSFLRPTPPSFDPRDAGLYSSSMAHIQLDDLVKAALGTAKKDFPASPRVVDFRYQVGTDATGENAVWVWVVLDDATPKAALRHASFEPIAEQIRTGIRKALRESAQFQSSV